MARLWEGVPASPCSADSDDVPMHSPLHPDQLSKHPDLASPLSDVTVNLQKRPLSADLPADNSLPALKRSRSDIMDVESASRSASPSVEFVEATAPNSQPASAFVAHLNISAQDEQRRKHLSTSAQDERRRQLLLRLRAIDAKKAEIAQHSSPVQDDDDVIVVASETPCPPKSSRTARGRKPRQPPRKKPTRGKKATPAPPLTQVIDVDAESSSSTLHKPRAKASPRAKKSSQAGKALSMKPTRTSSRVRRPRTPNEDAKLSHSEVRVPTPVCMTKCKRFQFCKRLITSLLRDPRTGPFSAPVMELWPKEAIPRYFDVISQPMDLRTVKRNIESSVYISPCKNGILPYQFEVDKFMDDVCLVFRNAMVYNRQGDMLFNCARDLLEDFEKTVDEQLPANPPLEAVAKSLTKKRSTGCRGRRGRGSESPAKDGGVWPSDSPTIASILAPATAKPSKQKESWAATVGQKGDSETSELAPSSVAEMRERLTYLRNSRMAVVARTPIPKGSGYLTRAALLYDVEISHSQKQRCVGAIESRVPIGKMEALLDMVKTAGGGYVASDDEEFVFEFDKLDNKAWRNVEAFLEQFVPGFKTIRHSTFGREFSCVDEVDEEMATLQESLKKASAKERRVPKEKADETVPRPRSFFGADGVDDDSSSDESGDESDSSDESDSESEAE